MFEAQWKEEDIHKAEEKDGRTDAESGERESEEGRCRAGESAPPGDGGMPRIAVGEINSLIHSFRRRHDVGQRGRRRQIDRQKEGWRERRRTGRKKESEPHC